MNFKNMNWLFFAIGFFVPVAGYVLYLVYQNKDEKISTSSGWGSLLGVAFEIIFALVFILFIM